MTDRETIRAEDYRRLIAFVNAEERGELVRVVRCKECKHCAPVELYGEVLMACGKGYGDTPFDWFCADGERCGADMRENTNDTQDANTPS